jgi:hypothetical protein
MANPAKPKGAQKSNLFLDFANKSSSSKMAEPVGLEPSEFDVTAPVARPDVPKIEDQLPKEASNGDSLLGSFLNVMDNIVPDDMGGMIRGQSGWLSSVPAYKETVGAVAGVPLSAAESVINVVNWGSEQMNHLGAALFSAMPGGIQTLDWEQSQDVSLGQVVTANAAINNARGGMGWLINVATLQTPFALGAALSESQDPDNILYSDDFDILDSEQRKQAFESGGINQFASGFADAIWMVAADPTILAGKATNIIRLGTKAGEFGGLSNQALKNFDQIERFGAEVVDDARLIDELGIEGARSSGRLGAEGENLISALEGTPDTLVNHPWVRSSGFKRDTRMLLGSIGVDDPVGAAHVVAAMAGRPQSWDDLAKHSIEQYDAVASTLGVDIFAPVGDDVFDTAIAGIRLTDDQLAKGDDLIYERLAFRPELLPDAARLPEQMFTRGGSRVGPRTVRAAAAWRKGATRSQFDNNAFKRSSSSDTTGKGHFVYDTIEGVAGSRPVQVVRWLGQGTPNGIIYVKDGSDGQSSLTELTNWLRKSPLDSVKSSAYLNEYAMARTVGERTLLIKRMQEEVVTAVAAERGITPTMAMEIFKGYDAKRAAALQNIAKSETKFYVDPETGKAVKVPDFYSELDQAVPLLDVKYFSKVISQNKWLQTSTDVKAVADWANSMWKVSVLLRLGYTQRNLAEGAMRSFATLGMVAANPQAWAALPANAWYYAGARRALKGTRRSEKQMKDAYTNLQSTRNLLTSQRATARVDDMFAARAKAADLNEKIRLIERKKTQTPAELASVEKMKVARDKALAKETRLKEEYVQPAIPELTRLSREEQLMLAEMDDLSQKTLRAYEVLRAKRSKRKVGGTRSNVMGYDADGKPILYEGAFEGTEGTRALLASSADRTVYQTFDAAAGKRIESLMDSPDFKKLDPSKLTPAQMVNYWDEYSIRINHRYRDDPIGRMILENRPIDEIKAWALTTEGLQYRKQLSVTDRNLDSEAALNEYIDNIVRRLDNEMPKDTPLRQLALDHPLEPGEVAAALGGRELPIIVGRLEDGVPTTGLFNRTRDGVDSITATIMKYLGTVPENKMLRHPFYKTVYNDRQAQLYATAARRGDDMGSAEVKARINKAAHGDALKATKETMYTIDNLSNAAVMLRFVSPFFPAFENSLRTWGRIAWNNPAVIGYGNILWNIPNNLGMVYDEEGNRVEQSNMLRDEGNYIVWPEVVANLMRSEYGPFTPGEAVRTRQQGFNTIFPGGEWWFPGVGPATQIPTALVLRGKPEEQEILRNTLGDEMFRQIVPSGNPNVDLAEAVAPTFARRVKQWLGQESTDSAYLTSWNQIIEDEYIAAQLEGRTLTENDMKKIKEKADRFWGWQVTSALVMPFQSSLQSRYQVERDAWGRLLDDESIPYAQKVKLFLEQYPGFDAITRAGSYNETKLQPNLATWQKITKNPDLVDDLYAIDPELVGMFGNMGSFDDPFSYAVYGEFGSMRIGPEQTRVRRKMTPDEILRNNQIKDGWRDYWLVKDAAEEKAIQLGFSSLQVNDAEELRNIIDKAEAQISERYPAWGEERQIYTDKLPAILQGVNKIIQNADLVDEDSTVTALKDYMVIRQEIRNSLAETDDDSRRKEIKEIGYAAAFKLRQRDIGFADFYDQYLYRDDFREA